MNPFADLTVADLMNRAICHVSPDCTLAEAARQMTTRHISSVLVLAHCRVLGILTERDMLRLLRDHVPQMTSVEQVMTAPVLTVTADMDFDAAYQLTLTHHIRHLVVVDADGMAIGLLSETDFRQHLGMNTLRQLDDLKAVMDSKLPLLAPSDSLDQALTLMLAQNTSYLVVVENGCPVGMVTERDATALLLNTPNGVVDQVCLCEVMHAPVRTVPYSTPVFEVANLMQQHHIRHMVVVTNEGKIAGVVTQHHLMERIARLLGHEKLLQEQRQTKHEQQLADQRLLLAAESAGLGFWVLTLNPLELHYSEFSLQILGLEPADAPSAVAAWLQRVHPDDRSLVSAHFQSARSATRTTIDCEYRMQHKAGHWLWIHNLGRVVEWADTGQPTLAIGVSMNITERKQTEVALAESLNLLKTIIDTAPLRIFWKDKSLHYLGCNPIFAQDAGKSSVQEIIGQDDFQMGWHAQAALYREDDLRVMASGRPKRSYEEPQTTADGKTIWLRTSKVPLRNHANDIIGVLGVYDDITEQKLMQLALERSEATLKRAQAVAQIGSWFLDVARNQLEWSDETYYMFGIAPDTAMNYETFLEYVYPEDRALLDCAWREALKGQPYYFEHRIVVREEVRWMEERAELHFDAAGQCQSAVGTVQDITDRKRNQERIEFLAHFDALTGLPNRAHLAERVKYALSLAKRGHQQLALIFLDLDHFKDINDTLGHRVGDGLLVALSKRLRQFLREEDTVARLGGDEFILLLPNIDADGAAQVVQKLLRMVSEPYQIEQYELNVTVSVGIAVYPEDGMDLETLSRNADSAMYRAKQAGRNSYRFYTGEMQARSARNLQVVNALRSVLMREQLHLHFQPQLSLHHGGVIGAETLLRWDHPELGEISPAEFIPIAEDTGMILSIGEWVLRQTIQQAKIWYDQGLILIVAVNLSVVQFRDPSLPDLITNLLNEYDLPPACLELELTESVAMHDAQAVVTTMNLLHERGIRMSIDDFGTGYSSLSYLKKFKVYKLKIDQSFVRDISTDMEDKAIVGAIIQMSKSLGLLTLAEGVETESQLAFLREQGCDEVQGYYYSKPLPAEQFIEFAKHRN